MKLQNIFKRKMIILAIIVVLLATSISTYFANNYYNQFVNEGKKIALEEYKKIISHTNDYINNYKDDYIVYLTKFDLYNPVFTAIEITNPNDESETKQYGISYDIYPVYLTRNNLNEFKFTKKQSSNVFNTDTRKFSKEELESFVSKYDLNQDNPKKDLFGSGSPELTTKQLEERMRAETANNKALKEEERQKNRTTEEYIKDETDRFNTFTIAYNRCKSGERDFTLLYRNNTAEILYNEDFCNLTLTKFEEEKLITEDKIKTARETGVQKINF